LTPKRQYFETVQKSITAVSSPHAIDETLNPLIKDYKLKPVYEIENNKKYRQMLENGSKHYRANFDNRNKIIWNNTDFRLFNRDNPTTLEILPVDGIPLKAVRDKVRMVGFEKRMPEEDPEVRSRFVQQETLFNTSNFVNYGERLPNSSYQDFHGSIRMMRDSSPNNDTTVPKGS
jgi:hypothetical protein